MFQIQNQLSIRAVYVKKKVIFQDHLIECCHKQKNGMFEEVDSEIKEVEKTLKEPSEEYSLKTHHNNKLNHNTPLEAAT